MICSNNIELSIKYGDSLVTRPVAPPAALALAVLLGAGLLVGLIGCSREPLAAPATASAEPAPAVPAADGSAAPMPAPAVEVSPAPGRASLTVGGDHAFTADGAVACRLAFDPTVPAGRPSLQVTVSPDDAAQPRISLTAPGFDAAGSYAAVVSLRLDTTDGTFTESTGNARLAIATVADGAGPPRLTGEFTASFSGAAGEGRTAGRFGPCRPDME